MHVEVSYIIVALLSNTNCFTNYSFLFTSLLGVDTTPPKALEWTVKRTMRRIQDEVTRGVDLPLPRTLKNHWSNEQLIQYRDNEKEHKRRIKKSKSFIDNSLPRGFKPRRYKKSSSRQRRKTNIGIERRKKSQNIASSHYQRWLIRDNIFYGKAHEHNLFSYGHRPATVSI